MNNKKNLFTSFLFQVITIISGLILPRIIIGTFGSALNGLIASITQFLSFISLLEGGLGAVVLAELYRPLAERDDIKVKSILYSCQNFFKKLSFVFVLYTVVLSVVYGIQFRKEYSFGFVCSLVYILSFTTLVQYLFSISYKLLLQAQQKIYIVNLVSSLTVLVNLLFSLILIIAYPSIHLIKLCSAFAFLLQPIILKKYIDNKFYNLKEDKSVYQFEIEKRWDGFAQNLAHFVNLNTDIIVITIFMSLTDVSIYTVYLLPITALRSIISSMTNSYQSALGKYYTDDERTLLISNFEKFNRFNLFISIVMFGTCIILINPFVALYTADVHDINYIQPIFSILIVVANMMFCIREPYRVLVLAAGKFKETNVGAIVEAVINLIVSILLIKRFGLIGVAVGTILAILYRFIYLIIYLKNDVLYKPYNSYLYDLLKTIVFILANGILFFYCGMSEYSIVQFCLYGACVYAIELLSAYILFYKLNKGVDNV
ncbi:MAG: polysaccharide biosynthesis C-terminal domain-containing protein [Clostridia bacterium]